MQEQFETQTLSVGRLQSFGVLKQVVRTVTTAVQRAKFIQFLQRTKRRLVLLGYIFSNILSVI
jgi:hypothetical protein